MSQKTFFDILNVPKDIFRHFKCSKDIFWVSRKCFQNPRDIFCVPKTVPKTLGTFSAAQAQRPNGWWTFSQIQENTQTFFDILNVPKDTFWHFKCPTDIFCGVENVSRILGTFSAAQKMSPRSCEQSLSKISNVDEKLNGFGSLNSDLIDEKKSKENLAIQSIQRS